MVKVSIEAILRCFTCARDVCGLIQAGWVCVAIPTGGVYLGDGDGIGWG